MQLAAALDNVFRLAEERLGPLVRSRAIDGQATAQLLVEADCHPAQQRSIYTHWDNVHKSFVGHCSVIRSEISMMAANEAMYHAPWK